MTRSTSAYRATSTVTGTSFRDDDERSYCPPTVRYDVRALYRGTDGRTVRSAPATTTVASRTNCTPDVAIGALDGGSGQATVTLLCTGGRGGNNHGTLAVLVDGERKWSTECQVTSAGGQEYKTTVTGLAPGTHQVTATSSSLSGTTRTPAQTVTVG